MIIINLTNFLVFSHKASHIWLLFVINNIPTFVSSWSVITAFPKSVSYKVRPLAVGFQWFLCLFKKRGILTRQRNVFLKV